MSNAVTFLSAKKRGMNIDLKLIQEYLRKRFPDITYRYFTGNELTDNEWKNQGIRKLKEEFCRDTDTVICMDASVSGSLKNVQPGQKRILLALPFDYQFYNFLEEEEMDSDNKKLKKGFKGFTHIIAPSLFCRKMLEQYYDLTDITVISEVCTPFGRDICDPVQQRNILEQMKYYFPEIERKKVIAILISGEKEEEDGVFEEADWEKILDHMGKENLVLTNSRRILNGMTGLPLKYRESFGYMDNQFPARNLLAIADVLITNNGLFASYFAAKRKEVYCLESYGTNFEQYMEKYYGELYLKHANDMLKIDFAGNSQAEKQKEFQEFHSYEPGMSPFEKIAEIVVGK
ncbi:MAG: hypothetical protein ACI4EI_02170 [Muricoprocola sp.]